MRSLDLDLDALEMPGIDGDLRSVLTELGAKFSVSHGCDTHMTSEVGSLGGF